MKAKLLISSLLLGIAILALAKNEDPVLMTINGKDVRLSEFEYLYNKNNQQQIEKEPLDKYVELFVLYKQKVADAEAAGIDTTQAFIKEFEVYQKQLAAPYLTEDTTYLWQMINETYDRYKKELDIDHIMLPLGTNDAVNAQRIAMLDSLRNCVIAGEDWTALADRYSTDPYKQRNHGHFGFVSACMFPADMENVIYSTPIGEVSKPFVNSFGISMFRVNKMRDRNDVHAKHILKMFPQNATEEQKAVCKAKIDSIYQLIKAGADFEELARTESDDHSNAKNGGDLRWFGPGRMVQPFDSIAFNLPDGAISEPFATQFGYHIIKKVAHGVPSLGEVRQGIENAFKRDGRMKLVEERRLNDLKNKYKYRLDPAFESLLNNTLMAHGRLDSAFVAQYIKGAKTPLFTYGAKQSVPVKALMSQLNTTTVIPDPANAKKEIMTKVNAMAEQALKDYDAYEAVKNNPEYRNLLNEYRDGMMLFEISNRRVWKAAEKDTAGLIQHYNENRSKYGWDEPHFKGIILYAKSDSVLNLVKADLTKFGADTLADALYNKYGNDIRMEHMVVKKGENPYADYLAFHVGDKPNRPNYPEYIIIEGGIIDQPEEMADVRGAVTSGYQDVLEQRWKQELAKKYPAKINKKVLKKVK